GQGAPPRGPLAPWFIGPEQMDAATLTANGVNATLPSGVQIKEPDVCEPSLRSKIWRLLVLLCTRDKDRESLARVDDLRLFRAALDAYDRHELVLLSSAYGLPVIGKRNPAPPGSDITGGLVLNSGQIEPGDEFPVLDVDDSQAIQRPQQLRVHELWLSALGGSLVHDTQFFPSAGANNLWGGKI